MLQKHVVTTLGLKSSPSLTHSSTSSWNNIKHKQKCHSSTIKAKKDKVEFFKTLEEIVDKFTWDQVIIDPQLNFAPRTRVYHHWIKIKSKLDTFFNKLVEEYQTQYKSVIHPLLRLKKIKTNSKDFFWSPKCLRTSQVWLRISHLWPSIKRCSKDVNLSPFDQTQDKWCFWPAWA